LKEKRKNKNDNVLHFRAPTWPSVEEKPLMSPVYFQIGSTRFAVRMWCESLPPAPPRPVLEPSIKKKTDLVLMQGCSLGTECASKVTAHSFGNRGR
jgi:hypothetical protein